MSLSERILLFAKKIDPSVKIEQPSEEYQLPQIWVDPRPDLKDDHPLWNRLLQLTFGITDDKESFEICGVLNGIRCGGTLLVKSKNGYKFQPLIDKQMGFNCREDYDELKEKYLKPHAYQIKVLLKTLSEEVK